MAPRLEPSRIQLICDMLSCGEKISYIASIAKCSRQAVYYIRSNLEHFDSARAPPIHAGRRCLITPSMLEALCDCLLEKPTLYLDEMAFLLWDEFDIHVSACCIRKTFASISWSKKTVRQKAKERNQDLRDEYIHYISEFRSYQLVFVDESGCDKRAGFRRTGWSLFGVAPVKVSKFHRDKRYQILPAYTQGGIMLSRIFWGSTDAYMFEDFVEQLLRRCGRWPKPKSVLVMDNASFHHSDWIEDMRFRAGFKLVYLPLYSPDLNPIEEFFAELKAFIKRNWEAYEEIPAQGFDSFLEGCVDTVGEREQNARGHFRHAGLAIEDI